MKSALLTFHGFEEDEHGAFAKFYVYGNFTAKMVAFRLTDSDQLPLFEQVLSRTHTAKLKGSKDAVTVRFPLHCKVTFETNGAEKISILPHEKDKALFSRSHFISCDHSGKVERQITFAGSVINQITPNACFYDEDEPTTSDR